ncbi:MAG: peptide chain release factor 2, partial [Chloroflexota bacterium]|nr:peptide chain release factor 2 [Chloroflexota bacterium]
TQEPGFWDDQQDAQGVLREADGLRTELGLWRGLLDRADELLTFIELIDESGGDPELEAELERKAAGLEGDFRSARGQLMFSGPYDAGSAILSISAGAGGTEATDWAEMLLRMYLRWAENHRYKTEIVDRQEGEQAGIKSATVEVEGRSAYGFLRAEKGVHRLVRISPFDAQNRRQTTFALVEVMPEAEDDIEIELDWDEIRVDTYRSQGAGGQHVNKTDSAVRLTHLPTGIVAQSQNERSQTQNKETAIKVLKARLLERALEEKEAVLRELRGEHVEAGWGNQIRSYVLHPYQMVKDLRTGQETSNTGAVLDGDLDAFMLAELEREATLDGQDEAGRPSASGRA